MKAKFRPFSLIEVLIAMALVALCALPLLYPHYAILKEERLALRRMELDSYAALLYKQTVKDLFHQKINWPEIQNEQAVVLQLEELEASRLMAVRRFKIERKKENIFLLKSEITLGKARAAYQRDAEGFLLNSKNEERFSYDYFVVIDVPSAQVDDEEEES